MTDAADPAPIRVVIVDDHPVVRRGLRSLLETLPGIEVVGEASDGAAAVREVQLSRPDAVLMDVQMPAMDGIQATRQIGACCPGVAVLILTMFDDDATVFTAMQAGARGYLLKGADQDEIARALRAVVAGEVIFGPQVAARVLSFFAASATTAGSASDPSFPELSERECQILDLLASGQRTAAIAERLYLSPKTVSNNLTAIFAKLQVASRAEAIVLARERGLGGGR
ncbi:MAG: response regulator transcription factor [Candidatus Nanopelagicales bacterium]|nr:response regulator transcription factor [Candidatus Nanopelagicales bacterium]